MVPENEFFEQYRGSVEAAWVKRIVSAFYDGCDHLRQKMGDFRGLKTPAFKITREIGRLGFWDSANKTLGISMHLLRNYTWEDVVQVLRHEMAHMICSEIWAEVEDNGRSHGELFAKACEIMGVPVSTHLVHGYDFEQKEKLVGKIQKLLALGESHHEAEAESAITKAYELMTRHNVSVAGLSVDERKFVFRPVGEIYGRIPLYVTILSQIIEQHYFVRRIFCHYEWDDSGYRREYKRFVEIYGEPHNVDVAEYVYHFLLAEGDRQWEEFKKNLPKKHGYTRAAFLEGFFSGFARTLRTDKIMEEVNPGNTLPIGVNDPLLGEKFREHYNPRSWGTGRGGSSGRGRNDGAERGAKVRVRQGVTRSGSETKLLT